MEVSKTKNLESKEEVLEIIYPKYGLCSFSKSCELYTPHDYECNCNRGPFIKFDNPHCYKPKDNLKI